jgi:HD-GYP domain-containing protein (c-di-GMP phosphodiesterase class II)
MKTYSGEHGQLPTLNPDTSVIIAARNVLDLSGEEPIVDITDVRSTPPQELVLPERMGGVSQASYDYTTNMIGTNWVVRGFLQEIAAYDPAVTWPHSFNAGQLAAEYADRTDMDEVDKKTLVAGTLIHDNGKTITLDPDTANGEERINMHEDTPVTRMIKMHPEAGARAAQSRLRKEVPNDKPGISEDRMVRLMIATHHCYIEGGAAQYPDEAGRERLIEESVMSRGDLHRLRYQRLVKTLAVIDVYEAITAKRPYQTAADNLDDSAEIRRILEAGYPDMGYTIDIIMAIHVDRTQPSVTTE